MCARRIPRRFSCPVPRTDRGKCDVKAATGGKRGYEAQIRATSHERQLFRANMTCTQVLLKNSGDFAPGAFMKKLALACALGMALCANAAADDMHGAATHDWSGHFIGLHGGGAWGDTQTVQGVLTTGDYSLDGAFGGWTSGANWQSGNWVWGYESDTSFGDIDGSTPSPCSGSCYAEVNWFSTIRGRLGYAQGMFLFYATAGLAYGEVEGGISAGAPLNGATISTPALPLAAALKWPLTKTGRRRSNICISILVIHRHRRRYADRHRFQRHQHCPRRREAEVRPFRLSDGHGQVRRIA